MPTTQKNEQQNTREEDRRGALNAQIRNQVIENLGEPHDFLHVSVRPLWENNYRVNVLAGKDLASARIANSYFLAVDADGHILTSAPAITRQYDAGKSAT